MTEVNSVAVVGNFSSAPKPDLTSLSIDDAKSSSSALQIEQFLHITRADSNLDYESKNKYVSRDSESPTRRHT